MFAYESQRVFFEVLLKKYKDYLELYRFFNHGSIEGATPFEHFYWVQSFICRHASLAAENNIAR